MMDPLRGSRLAAGALVLCALSGVGEPQTTTEHSYSAQATHGAASMQAQVSVLDGLLAGHEAGRPAEVDPDVWRSYVPDGGVLDPARVELGRKLYFEPRLSADDTVACATCHDTTRAFTDHRNVSEGIRDQLGHRNAPTTMNVVLLEPLFLDGRAATLEEQAGMPILNPVEMGQPNKARVVQKVRGIPEYAAEFQQVFGRAPEYEDIQSAIAAFERTLIFLDAPFDRFLAGDDGAISDDARAGWVLYNGRARCVTCHPINPSNPLGSDFRFHNVGVSARHQNFEALATKALKALETDPSEQKLDELAVATDMSELGRFMITKRYDDIGGFRTLQVRNVGITAPYMHDGSMQTLWDVMDHYNKGGEANPYLDGGMEPLALSEAEIDQLVALMFSMTDTRFADQNAAAMAAQKARAAKERPFRDEGLAMRRTIQFETRVEGGGEQR